jgi:hypothetical protein
MWDILEDDYYVLSTTGGEAFQVSNGGHVAFRKYSDEGKVVPTIWFEANCSDLSEPSGGDVIVITPDASQAAGHVARETFGSIPALWIRDANNEWISEPQWWHELENSYQTSIRGLSADGSIGVGRTLISGYTGPLFETCFWPNKETMLLINISQEEATEFTCISANGKYAGIRRSGYPPYIFDLQTQELTQLPGGDIINAITNDGLSVGISGNPQLGSVPFVYSAQLGFLTFSQFIQSAYASSRYEGIDEDIIDGISVVNRIMSISSDGCNWALQANTDGYMLHLKRKLLAQPATTPPVLTKIYFDPANNQVYVEGEGFNQVKIYDIFGRELKNANIQAPASFDISAFENGIYLVTVYDNGRVIGTKKVAKDNR